MIFDAAAHKNADTAFAVAREPPKPLFVKNDSINKVLRSNIAADVI